MIGTKKNGGPASTETAVETRGSRGRGLSTSDKAHRSTKLPPKQGPIPGQIDAGIRRAVEQLQAGHIETFESCEGGEGHAYPEPTVAFHGGPEAGWRAVAVCLEYKLPVLQLRRRWDVLDGEPTGPYWEVTFRQVPQSSESEATA